MKASEFIKILEVVAPAVSTQKQQLELLKHFWFSGGKVTAFNDLLAMECPCPGIDDEFTAPLHMLDLLRASNLGSKLDFEFRETEFDLYTGDQFATLSTFNVRDAFKLFTFPKAKPNTPVFADLIGKASMAIDVCLLATTTDLNFPERQGITIIPEDDKLALYAFHNQSFCRCELNGKGAHGSRITVPADFWRIFQNLTKGMDSKEAKGAVTMVLDADFAFATVGGVKLFCKTLPVKNPTDLRKTFNKHYNDDEVAKNLVPVTADFMESIARAVVLSTGVEDKNCRTRLQVKKNELSIKTSSQRGEQDDLIPVKHPNTKELKVQAPLLADALNHFSPSDKALSKVAFSDVCVVLQKAERVYMVNGV